MSYKIPIERFLSKIKISKNGCWEWTDVLLKNGYGKFRLGLKKVAPHRFIYEYYHGQICPDLVLDHLCRNPSCVNVNHLEQVTMKVNVHRGFSIWGINSRKIKCIHGHLFDKKNTYLTFDNKRKCKICINN